MVYKVAYEHYLNTGNDQLNAAKNYNNYMFPLLVSDLQNRRLVTFLYVPYKMMKAVNVTKYNAYSTNNTSIVHNMKNIYILTKIADST